MIRSMTGFAAKTITLTKDQDNRANVSMQLKALNSRYFEVNCKLPYALSHLETSLAKLFKKHLRRGYIHFTVYLDNPNIFKGDVRPSMNTIEGYMKALHAVKTNFKIDEPVSLGHLLSLQNIFTVEEQAIDEDSTQAFLHATQELIDRVIHERETEGAALQKDLEQRLSVMTSEIEAVFTRSKQTMENQKKRVAEVVKELQDDASELAEARKTALYTILDKIDIHEEIVRFKSHVQNMQKILAADVPEKGKRIDFTLQEMAREINTIAAKCSDATISSHAINIKVEIEKAREQVQNVV